MTWFELSALIAALVAGAALVLVLALCRAAKLGDAMAERANRAWLAGPGRESGSGPPATGANGDTVHEDGLDPDM